MIILLPIIFILCLKIPALVSADITNAANYQQSIKYSNVFLELNYSTVTGFVNQKFELTQQNPLITVLKTKKDVTVSGRLLLVTSEVSNTHKANETQSMRIDGACSKISTVSNVTWIAVIRKGGHCTLKDKLHNTLVLSNASAVIIIDNTVSRVLEKYDFDNHIGLHLTDLAISSHILMNESIFINASITILTFVVDGFISRTSVLFVSISFILLMIISLVWLTFYYIQRFRYMHAKERLSRRLANAAKKALHKIPLKTLSLGDNEVSYDFDQCAICIDNYQAGETIRILPCKHIFHKMCIDSWLIEQRSCPMCKVDILKACGIISVTSNKNSNNRPGALLEVGPISSDPETGDSSNFDAVESTINSTSRCRRGKSSFLQRYRDRYGLNHYYQGHIKNHCHRYNGHYHRKCIHHCSNHRDKFNASVEMGVDITSVLQKAPSVSTDAERLDLISESENSIASLHQIPLTASANKEDSKITPRLSSHYEDLHEISQGLICDICECNSENTPVDCDICGSAPNNSTSTSCSCESCDCYSIERDCRHFDGSRNNSARIGNLLGCCVSSDVNRHRPSNRNAHEQPAPTLCCYNPCSHCRNQSIGNSHVENEFSKSHLTYKQCSSKSRCDRHIAESHGSMPVKIGNNLVNVNQFTKTQNSNSYSSRIGGRKKDYENLKQLKSIQLTKNMHKCATIDSYTKSSLSDEFDFEADGASSSLEIAVPAVKLTVLPPQVQYHQGSPNSDSSHTSSRTAEVNISAGSIKYVEYQEFENCKSDSIIQNSSDPTEQC